MLTAAPPTTIPAIAMKRSLAIASTQLNLKRSRPRVLCTHSMYNSIAHEKKKFFFLQTHRKRSCTLQKQRKKNVCVRERVNE